MIGITASRKQRERQIDTYMHHIMQIPGSWYLGVSQAACLLRNALCAKGIIISSEYAYRKVIQYANKH